MHIRWRAEWHQQRLSGLYSQISSLSGTFQRVLANPWPTYAKEPSVSVGLKFIKDFFSPRFITATNSRVNSASWSSGKFIDLNNLWLYFCWGWHSWEISIYIYSCKCNPVPIWEKLWWPLTLEGPEMLIRRSPLSSKQRVFTHMLHPQALLPSFRFSSECNVKCLGVRLCLAMRHTSHVPVGSLQFIGHQCAPETTKGLRLCLFCIPSSSQLPEKPWAPQSFPRPSAKMVWIEGFVHPLTLGSTFY